MVLPTKLEKFVSSLMMNITKMRKTLKFKKFMIIFTKIWTEKRIIFVIFIFKSDANFPSLQPKSAYFFNLIYFICFMRQKNTSILAVS